MYNIDMYTYWKKPYLTNRKYGIHPLDEPGFEKYIGPESHCVNYLSRINPKVLKNIIKEDYETVVNRQKEKLQGSRVLHVLGEWEGDRSPEAILEY